MVVRAQYLYFSTWWMSTLFHVRSSFSSCLELARKLAVASNNEKLSIPTYFQFHFRNFTFKATSYAAQKMLSFFAKKGPTRFWTTVLEYQLLILGKSKSIVFRIYRGRLTCGSRDVFESFVTAPRACNLSTRTHRAAHSPHTAAAQYADHEFHETRKCGTSPAGV